MLWVSLEEALANLREVAELYLENARLIRTLSLPPGAPGRQPCDGRWAVRAWGLLRLLPSLWAWPRFLWPTVRWPWVGYGLLSGSDRPGG